MKKSKRILLSLTGSIAIAACGAQGEKGEKGDSCTVVTNDNGSATIKCTDGSSFTVKNGDTGSDGNSCRVITNDDGSGKVACTDGSSYLITSTNMPTAEGYDYCLPGYFGPDCLPCTCKNGTCNGTTQGDGKCTTCNNKWTGDNCDVCPSGWDNSNEGRCAWCDSTHFGNNCQYATGAKGSMTDKHGNTYSTITIVDQVWMAENMRDETDVTCYRDNNNSNWTDIYGCLYSWEDAKKLCPSGWRLPTKDDFEQLLTATQDRRGRSSLLASSWSNASNSAGFGALPAGHYYSGDYLYFGIYGEFWSSTGNDDSYAYSLHLSDGSALVSSYFKAGGLSVRCLRD